MESTSESQGIYLPPPRAALEQTFPQLIHHHFIQKGDRFPTCERPVPSRNVTGNLGNGIHNMSMADAEPPVSNAHSIKATIVCRRLQKLPLTG